MDCLAGQVRGQRWRRVGWRRGSRARYRVRDWAAYNRSLARQGAITMWVSPDAVAGWRAPAERRTFSDAAIAAALTVRAVYHLASKQAEGLIASIFALLGLTLPVPDHTTLSRRGRALRLDRRADAGDRGLDFAIHSTGLRLSGWGHARGRKLHIGVDPDSGRMLAEDLTPPKVHDTRPDPPGGGRALPGAAQRGGRVQTQGARRARGGHARLADRAWAARAGGGP